MAYSLLAPLVAATERYPKFEPEFAEHVGWLCFGFVLFVLAYAWTRADSVRRAALALEDPRVWAVLRIGFGVMTFVCFINLAPYWRMLLSDEGIFDLEYAQDRLGRTALRGWTSEDGFFDVWAVLNFLWNKPSLFYMYGSPDFVVGYMIVFSVVLGLYTAGVFSRTTGAIAWLMMSGIYNRNALYLEGTDTVYRAFWFILLFARTGHAWSFDNWWRCRRLRNRGQLEDPSNRDESGPPKQPIYRLVPAWPRMLFMLQLAAIYITTGAVKTGNVWHEGDALYYALNMDHFYRFENVTQQVSSIFGMNLFRVNTWITHWWERLFPLLLIGMSLQFTLRHRDEPWYQRQNVPWRKWLGRALLLGAYVLVYRIVVLSVPYCLAMVDDAPADPTPQLRDVHIGFAGVVPAFAILWFVLGRRPLTLFRGGRVLRRASPKGPTLRIPEIVIDQAFLRGWLLGRRVWLTLGFIFHGFLILFMNIGMFPFIMLMTYAGFVGGDEFVKFFRRLVNALRIGTRTRRWLPASSDAWLVDAQPTATVPVRGRQVPDLLVLAFGALGAWLMFEKIAKTPWVGDATKWWLAAALVTSLGFRLMKPRAVDVARAKEPGPALAYGALGRALALFALVWHAGAVGTSLFPGYNLFSKWRNPARSVFSDWLSGTGTSQSWRMFAPNPPRSNAFMKTVVVLDDGEAWDLGANAFADRPNPWIINDRMRKMQRRMIGKGKWYLRYWALHQCREWALTHDGEVPAKIDIKKLVTKIPPPHFVNVWQPSKLKGRKDAQTGAISGRPYVPTELRVREYDVQSHDCGREGQLPLYMLERYGLPITDEARERAERDEERLARSVADRRERWEKRKDWGRWWADDDASSRAPASAKPGRREQADEPHDDDEAADASD